MNLEEKYEKLLDLFYEISKIPRNSTEENQIAEFLCNFAIKRNLEYKRDNLYNVLIKKKASSGYENKKAIIFQAHTDMVCEKTLASNHDFRKDSIEIINDGITLKAKDTTLGADDGIGVAFLLLLLEDEEILHPDIYCLFTTQEEIGMDGARNFDYSEINANYLINIDGEEENTAIVGCAGGARLKYEKEIVYENVCEKKNVYEISISGLRGGHSGVDIDKGRQNSNFLCAKLLEEIDDAQISLFIGGNKDNAIPNVTRCIFATKNNRESLESKVNELIRNTNFVEDDRDYQFHLKQIENENVKTISLEESKSILRLITCLKQGVIELSKEKEGLVETSGNVGIVNVEDGKSIITQLIRSSDDEKRKQIENYNNEMAMKEGYNITIESSYPGWKYKANSNIEKIYVESYKATHDNLNPRVEAIHAGVECGMIYEKMPHLELISIGPDIVDVHTVNETLYLESCKKVLKTVMKMLEMLD